MTLLLQVLFCEKVSKMVNFLPTFKNAKVGRDDFGRFLMKKFVKFCDFFEKSPLFVAKSPLLFLKVATKNGLLEPFEGPWSKTHFSFTLM